MKSRAVALVLFAFAGAAIAAAQSSPVKLVVADKVGAGAVIPRAFVIAHPDFPWWTHDERQNIESSTDAQGKITLSLKPVFWDLCVMADAFLPQCKKVQLRNRKEKHFEFVLEVSSEAAALVGDPVR